MDPDEEGGAGIEAAGAQFMTSTARASQQHATASCPRMATTPPDEEDDTGTS
jgi:hypothetical protein